MAPIQLLSLFADEIVEDGFDIDRRLRRTGRGKRRLRRDTAHRLPLRGGGRYVVQHAARRTLATVESDGPLSAHDIGQARIALHAPLFVDAYDAVRATGALTVIDEATDQEVGAGLVR